MEASKLEGPESGLSVNMKSCFPLVVKQLCPPYLEIQLEGQNLEGGERRLRILASGNSSGLLGDNPRAPERRKEGQAEASVLFL